MKLKIALAAAGVFASALFASGAQANPVYFGYSINGGPIVQAALADGGGGFFANPVGGPILSGSALGTPNTQQPDFLSSQTSVSLTGSAQSVAIYLSQTGLDFQAPGFLIGFGSNSSAVSITEAAYAQNCANVLACNTTTDVFNTSNELMSKTIAPGAATSNTIVAFPNSILTGNLYSETLVYTFNFATGSPGQNASATFNLQNVPEPLTLSLFGAGLAGVAGMRRRKKSA